MAQYKELLLSSVHLNMWTNRPSSNEIFCFCKTQESTENWKESLGVENEMKGRSDSQQPWEWLLLDGLVPNASLIRKVINNTILLHSARFFPVTSYWQLIIIIVLEPDIARGRGKILATIPDGETETAEERTRQGNGTQYQIWYVEEWEDQFIKSRQWLLSSDFPEEKHKPKFICL